MKSLVRELLGKLLVKDDGTLSTLFNAAVLGERQEPIIPPPKNKKFVLTENGGLNLIDEESSPAELLEKATVFLELIKVSIFEQIH